jgi:Mg2+/Co2+ transporter CorB
MTSLIIAFIVVLMASALPLAVDGPSWEGAAVMAGFTLLLWPLVALMRWLVGVIHALLTGRPAP